MDASAPDAIHPHFKLDCIPCYESDAAGFPTNKLLGWRPISFESARDCIAANKANKESGFAHPEFFPRINPYRLMALEALWSAVKESWTLGYSPKFTAAVQELRKLEGQ